MLLRPTGEEPLVVHPAVVVEVADRHDDPAVADFVFGAAVHGASGGVVVDDLDAVADDLVDRPVEPPHLGLDVLAQDLAALSPAPHVDVRHEQPDPRVEVTTVDGEGVADRQLLDRLVRLDPGQSGQQVILRSGRCQAVGRRAAR